METCTFNHVTFSMGAYFCYAGSQLAKFYLMVLLKCVRNTYIQNDTARTSGPHARQPCKPRGLNPLWTRCHRSVNSMTCVVLKKPWQIYCVAIMFLCFSAYNGLTAQDSVAAKQEDAPGRPGLTESKRHYLCITSLLPRHSDAQQTNVSFFP